MWADSVRAKQIISKRHDYINAHLVVLRDNFPFYNYTKTARGLSCVQTAQRRLFLECRVLPNHFDSSYDSYLWRSHSNYCSYRTSDRTNRGGRSNHSHNADELEEAAGSSRSA